MTVRTLTRTRRQPNPPVCERRFQPLHPRALSLPCDAHIMSCSLAIPANAGMAEQIGRKRGYKPGATRKRRPDFVMPDSSARDVGLAVPIGNAMPELSRRPAALRRIGPCSSGREKLRSARRVRKGAQRLQAWPRTALAMRSNCASPPRRSSRCKQGTRRTIQGISLVGSRVRSRIATGIRRLL